MAPGAIAPATARREVIALPARVVFPEDRDLPEDSDFPEAAASPAREIFPAVTPGREITHSVRVLPRAVAGTTVPAAASLGKPALDKLWGESSGGATALMEAAATLDATGLTEARPIPAATATGGLTPAAAVPTRAAATTGDAVPTEAGATMAGDITGAGMAGITAGTQASLLDSTARPTRTLLLRITIPGPIPRIALRTTAIRTATTTSGATGSLRRRTATVTAPGTRMDTATHTGMGMETVTGTLTETPTAMDTEARTGTGTERSRLDRGGLDRGDWLPRSADRPEGADGT